MKDDYEVLILPEVENFLEDLPNVLYLHDYCSFLESAEVLFGEIKSLFANAGEVEMITDVVETVCQVTPAQGFTEKGAL